MQSFVDKFTSCSLQNDDDDDVIHIVSEVQIHRHSHSCKKYSTACRFGYPKFPSKKTIIAQSLDKDDFDSELEYDAKISEYKGTLDSVKKVFNTLEDDDLDDYTINDVLKMAKVRENDYYKALSISTVGTTVILKRKVNEIYVNNYNTEWIRAWNGNMDIQVCLDYHAVITYITDYYSKDESGTMDFLKKAMRENSQKDHKELMHLLSQVFLTHRQNGECEAYYKIFPSLHLTESNVKTTFVASNFPNQRHKFLVKVGETQKVAEDNHEEVNNDSDSEQEPEYPQAGTLVSVAGKEGKYTTKTSVHDRYSCRPKFIEQISFAQFSILYELCQKRWSKDVLFIEDVRGESEHKLISPGMTDTFLPNYIKLSNDTYMKVRKTPAVLRKHRFRIDTQYHEFLYSDLLFYLPWRSEDELFYDNFERCLELYETNRQHITFVQERLFPHMNSVHESQVLLDTASDFRASHIGDIINPQHEQDQSDQAEIGLEEDDNFSARNPEGISDIDDMHPINRQKTVYKRLDISDKESMASLTQQLDCDQRYVLNKVISYCKDLRKSLKHDNPSPKPPLLIVHGGAGSGKSMLINNLTLWAEHFLRTSDDRHPDHPLIIRTAPTGTAASNISGLTIHSSFNLRFGNDFKSLPDKQRDSQRHLLSNLQILIVDELSMMKADMLYQLNLRLQEIKQNKKDFGGVSILLFGDLMQLQPVKARWIFDEPRNPSFALSYTVRSLWSLFEVVELKTNHRQGDNKDYAELLNRVRIGIHTNTDLEILRSRVTSAYPIDSIHLFGKNKDVNDFNNHRLADLPGEEYVIPAINIHPARGNFKPSISKDGRVNDTPFLEKLRINLDARLMLTYNVDTADGLTNGALGQIKQVVLNNNSVGQILIRFDNKEVGRQLRNSQKEKSDLTPIGKISFSYSLGSIKKEHAATAKVVQFPIKLSWASTVHTFQGQTIKPPVTLVGHMESIFARAQAYVLFGRVMSLDQLYLTSCSDQVIKVSPEALEETKQLSKKAINNRVEPWQSENSSILKVSALNVRSLKKHIPDLSNDFTCLQI